MIYFYLQYQQISWDIRQFQQPPPMHLNLYFMEFGMLFQLSEGSSGEIYEKRKEGAEGWRSI